MFDFELTDIDGEILFSGLSREEALDQISEWSKVTGEKLVLRETEYDLPSDDRHLDRGGGIEAYIKQMKDSGRG
jgi:hypothetical protein